MCPEMSVVHVLIHEPLLALRASVGVSLCLALFELPHDGLLSTHFICRFALVKVLWNLIFLVQKFNFERN